MSVTDHPATIIEPVLAPAGVSHREIIIWRTLFWFGLSFGVLALVPSLLTLFTEPAFGGIVGGGLGLALIAWLNLRDIRLTQ